jgi:glycosyltransferase involved in cell wall biosynthesis
MARRSRWQPFGATAVSPGDLVFSGFLSETIGLGRAGQMAVGALQRAGLAVTPHDVRPVLKHYPRGGLRLPGGPGGVWIIQANAPECDAILQSIRSSDWAGRYRIGYWAWETTLAPSRWVQSAEWFHEIWSISAYSANAIRAACLKAGRPDLAARVRVMPCPTPRQIGIADRARFGLPPDGLVMLSTFDGRSTLARKNPMGVVAAWKRGIPTPTADVQLVIKSIESRADPVGFAGLRRAIVDRPDIRLIDARLTDEDMSSLMASCDVFLSLHRSEGFGLLLAEAMAMGKVVIATDYSAPAEWLTPEIAILVEATEVMVSDPSGIYRTGRWGEPDLAGAGAAIARAVRERAALRGMGARAALQAQDFDGFWTNARLSAQFWASLATCSSSPPTTLPKVQVAH